MAKINVLVLTSPDCMVTVDKQHREGMFMSIFLFVLYLSMHVHHCHGQSYILLVRFSRFSLSVGWWVYITVTMLNSKVTYTV